MPSIKAILISRDGISAQEADQAIAEAREELYELLEQGDQTAAYDICMTHFGLEPDYLDELL